ncbi:serine/threonine-protein kinase [Streptomyces sp. NPDC101152]|uniref:serine/threonine-protein kinase n=1 Tax=Streptomyces sp. NPDC101152 TaxID=3366116 RepID=UPI00382DDC18
MNDGDSGRRVVDGRFELRARLGGGGMGTVWRAHDLLLHRDVAVKEVRPADPDLAEYDPGSARMLRERVLREARALARVRHPNVVTIHHIVDGGADTYPWIVMELVDGGSLADCLAHAPLAPAEAARIGRGVLDALRAAHAAGVQHRDVKPANVLLRTDGRPVLTDFGIAAIRDSTALTATGFLIGTADYMAPERVTGDPGGPAADLWSLAMMLYVAVEGRHPLRRGTTLATLAAVLHEDVPPPERAGPLASVLERVLVRDPVVRPDAETVERMLAAVEEAGGTDPTATSYPLAPPLPPGPDAVSPATETDSPSRDTRRTGRLRRTVPVAVLAVAVLAGGGVWVALSGGGEGHDASGTKATRTPGPRGDTPAAAPVVQPQPGASSTLASGLLTPDGIRTALRAIEDRTGRNTFGDLKVYPEYVSVKAMVPGSQTRYDTYTYRTWTGVRKEILSGTLMGGDQPVSLKGFRWDRLPALLALAQKELQVDKPTSRYLWLQPPNDIRKTSVAMALYLGDDYAIGYLVADRQGRVTKVAPAGG